MKAFTAARGQEIALAIRGLSDAQYKAITDCFLMQFLDAATGSASARPGGPGESERLWKSAGMLRQCELTREFFDLVRNAPNLESASKVNPGES